MSEYTQECTKLHHLQKVTPENPLTMYFNTGTPFFLKKTILPAPCLIIDLRYCCRVIYVYKSLLDLCKQCD